MKYNNTLFKNVNDINSFFKKGGYNSFFDWFNKSIAGRGNFSNIRIKSEEKFNKVWINGTIMFNKDSFNLLEFICLNSIILNETGGTYIPLSESLGAAGHPGISYAFDRIQGLKKSYNTLPTNRSSYELFRDFNFKQAHIKKPLGNILADTTDKSWDGEKFPLGFSGNVPNEINISGKTNTFITEADFMKFRGRGYIQTTGRSAYEPIVKYVINYKGSNSVLLNIKKEFLTYSNNVDVILTMCTNQQLDDLFLKTNSIVANYAVWTHASSTRYSWINTNRNKSEIDKSIRNVASKVAGSGAKSYIDLFYNRVYQQLNDIETFNIDGVPEQQTSEPVYNDEVSENEDNGRSERTGENIEDSEQSTESLVANSLVSILQPTIKAKVIEFNLPQDKGAQLDIAESLGNIPLLWYNAYQIPTANIDYLLLTTDINGIPYLKARFSDPLGKMKDQGMPLDDTKISLFINPRSNQLKPIHLDFKITNFKIIDDEYVVIGRLSVNGLYINKFKSFKNQTSFTAIKNIAKELGMGFNSNINDTDDKMNWICIGDSYDEFLDHLVDNSYLSDESFLTYYLDYYYSINYIDIEKELNRDIKNEMGVADTGLDEIMKTPNKDSVNRLFLTNDKAMSESNNYFDSYTIMNNSTEISLEEGYYTTVKYYDKKRKEFLLFDIDSITSKDKIVLKGAPQDTEFYKENGTGHYIGKIDADNSHINLLYSYIHNNRNLTDIQKFGIVIELSTPNFNLYRCQKVFLYLSKQTPTPDTNMVNSRLTGEWIIWNIDYEFDDKVFKQKILLYKRELEVGIS